MYSPKACLTFLIFFPKTASKQPYAFHLISLLLRYCMCYPASGPVNASGKSMCRSLLKKAL